MDPEPGVGTIEIAPGTWSASAASCAVPTTALNAMLLLAALPSRAAHIALWVSPIPAFIDVSDSKLHDVNVLGILPVAAGAFHLMDRGYLDFERLYAMHQTGAFFVIRAKVGWMCSASTRWLSITPPA
jgi:hypothetical protein